MPFEFYIQGTQVDLPDNDMAMVTRISRNSTYGGQVITQENSLTWSANAGTTLTSGYTLLLILFESGVCNEADLLVYDRTGPTTTFLYYSGVIKLTQLVHDIQRTSLSVKIQDNSFLSYIYNNWELKVDFRAIQSKNKIDITPLDVYHIDLFNSLTGDYLGPLAAAYYHGYNMVEVLDFLIRAITDEKVSFRSDYLDNLTYPLMLFKGEALLNPYTLFPTSSPVYEISLKEALTELSAINNLSFYLDLADPENPVFRLEDTESTYSFYGNFEFNEPLHVSRSVDTSNLYGQVEVGSEVIVSGSTFPEYTFEEATSYYGWKRETFFPLGQCNTHTNLNLVNTWVLSNNAIQDILILAGTGLIDNYFLIQCSGVDTAGKTGNGHQFDYFGQPTPPVFYNLGINNFSKLQRHSDKFETVFGNFLGVGSLGFKALLGDQATDDITYMTGSIFNPNFIPPSGLTVSPAPFPNETTQGGYDGSNNYNNVLFRYVVPVGGDGDYSFHGHLNEEISGTTIDYFESSITITQYDSGMVQKASGGGGQSFLQDGFQQIDGTLVCSCVAGDIIEMSYTHRYIPNQAGSQNVARTLTVIWDSYFECNGTPEGGITIASGSNVKKLLYEFDYDLSGTEFRTIMANPIGAYPLVKDGVRIIGWIQDISYQVQTGRAQVKLITTNTVQ